MVWIEISSFDTGMESGLRMHANNSNTYNLEVRSNGQQSVLNVSTLSENETILNYGDSLVLPVSNEEISIEAVEGHGMFAFAEQGSIGLHDALHQGARRCVAIDVLSLIHI